MPGIEYDAGKRQRTLDERGLDFEDATHILSGFHFTKVDARKDYGEVRYITIGVIDDRPIILVWTPRGNVTRVISMRIADDVERENYWERVARS